MFSVTVVTIAPHSRSQQTDERDPSPKSGSFPPLGSKASRNEFQRLNAGAMTIAPMSIGIELLSRATPASTPDIDIKTRYDVSRATCSYLFSHFSVSETFGDISKNYGRAG
ncbi:MAG: hypothetical protein ACQET5_16455 [Halobacteriota archaeon]